MTADLVIAALNMGLLLRKPHSVIHHSDHGSQYTSLAFGKRCQEMNVQLSMGTVGDVYDNAMAESFFASLECELIARRSWKTKTEARLAIFTWIEGWTNRHRRHSALNYLSPLDFERNVLFTGASLEPRLALNPSDPLGAAQLMDNPLMPLRGSGLPTASTSG